RARRRLPRGPARRLHRRQRPISLPAGLRAGSANSLPRRQKLAVWANSWGNRSAGHLQSREVALRAPVGDDLEELHRPAAVEAVADAAGARLALVVVVAGGARLEEVEVELGQLEDRLDPGVLGLLGHLERAHVVVEHVAEDVGGVLALLVEGV